MSSKSGIKWAKENPEKDRIKSARWKKNNPEKVIKINKEQYKKHRKKILKRKKEIYWEDPEKLISKSAKWSRDNPEKKRITVLKSMYSLTEDEYRELLDETMGICPICNDEFDDVNMPCVDHNHKTNEVRGIICRSCNLMLGRLKDDVNLLLNAITYLRKGE